jgi:transcriptional regulator with GAF, ATPase, and Fis domain
MSTERTSRPTTDQAPTGKVGGDQWPGSHALKDTLEGIERDLILAALQDSHGNKAKAARALGITERFMGLRVKRLGIDWRGLRPHRKQSAAHSA